MKNTVDWLTYTKDSPMTIGLLVTMMVRIMVSKFTSFKYGIIGSVITGFIVTTLFFLSFLVNNVLILPSYVICLVICFFTFYHTDRKEHVYKTIFLAISTVVVSFIINFVASFVLEVKNECLGTDDAVVAEAYSLVGAIVWFVIGYQIINEIRLKDD